MEPPYEGTRDADPILVTGSLGTIGRSVVESLLAAGRPVRAAGRNRSRVAEAFAGRTEAVHFDFTEPGTWTDAFAGVQVMFLMRPPALSNIARDMVPALEAAKAAGVTHIVVLSLQGAETNRFVPHAAMEKWVRSSGLDWTFVRPSFFMENLSGTHVADIRDRDEILVPAGTGATSFVSGSDVAAVAATGLLDPAAHRNRAWTPTGPEALTYSQVADILSAVLGRPISYPKPGGLRFAMHALRTLHMPPAMVAVTTAIYTVARLGRAGGLTDDVQIVTGRAPVPLREWAEQNRAVWERPTPTEP